MHKKHSLVDMSPKDFVALFNDHVFGQEQAKMILAIALRNRYRTSQLRGQDRFNVHKQNVLFLGPTGTGKTSLIRVLRNYLELPVLEFDMTAFTESGYVGRSIEEIGRELRELVKTTKIPNWYLEANGLPASKEKEKRYTRAELEKIQEQEFMEQMDENEAHRKRYNEAYDIRLQELTNSGIYNEVEHKKTAGVFYLRALLLGMYRANEIADVNSLDSLLTFKNDKLDMPVLLEKLLKVWEIGEQQEKLNEHPDRNRIESEFEMLMSQIFHSWMVLTTEYVFPGLRYMASYPEMATAAHVAWAEFADQFEEEEEALEIVGLKTFDTEDAEFAILAMLLKDFEGTEAMFTSFEDFTTYNDPTLWGMPKFEDFSKEKIEERKSSGKTVKMRVDPKSFIENFAVVFLDEFDKLIEDDTSRSHVSRSGVQRGLLKMVEGGSYFGIDTTNVLFVAAGSFAANPVSKLMPELQGRFPLRAHLNALDLDAYIHICKMEGSEFQGHVALMKTENVKVNYDMDTFRVIAERTLAQNMVDNLGARRLGAVINAVFQPAMYEPEKYREIGFDITGETLRKPRKEK